MASAGPYAGLHFAPERQPHRPPPLCFLQAGCPSCRPTNSVTALKAQFMIITYFKIFAVGMSVDWIECLLCAKTTGHAAVRHHSPSFRSVTLAFVSGLVTDWKIDSPNRIDSHKEIKAVIFDSTVN